MIVNGRTLDACEKVSLLNCQAANEIRKSQPDALLEPFAADVTKPEDCEKVFATYPFVDVLVNNVGIFPVKPFAEITDEEWMV